MTLRVKMTLLELIYTCIHKRIYMCIVEAMETLKLRHPIYSKLKAWGLKPLVVDFYVQRVWSTFSLERIFARVASMRSAAQGIVTIHLRPNFNFKRFEAGQHVLLTTNVNGQRVTRTYSPTQLADRSLEITVKEIPNGKVSASLVKNLKQGALIELSEAFGEMTWSCLPLSTHYVFCAGGVGITPLRSLIHAWDLRDELHQDRKIELHYWAKSNDEHCFQQELGAIAQRHSGLRLHYYESQSEFHKVTLTTVLTTVLHTDLNPVVVVACGPQGFVQSAESIAAFHGLRFFGEHAQTTAPAAPDSHAAETFFEITYSGKKIQASSQKSILESLEAQGFEPAHGCRMGLCKSCTCMKKSGATSSAKDQSVSDEPNEEIQICVARPRSAINLERY